MRFLAVVAAIIAALGCLFGIVIPGATLACGYGCGFLCGGTRAVFQIGIISGGLAAMAWGIPLGIGLFLTNSPRLGPRMTTAVAVIPGVLVLVLLAEVSVSGPAPHDMPPEPEALPEIIFPEKTITPGEIWNAAFPIGNYHGRFPGWLLGGVAGLVLGGFKLTSSGRRVYDDSVTRVAHNPTSVVGQLMHDAAIRLEAFDKKIAPIAADLKVSWPKHSGTLDPAKFPKTSEQAVRRLIEDTIKAAETDLHELESIRPQWLALRVCFKKCKRELDLFNASRHEQDEFQAFLDLNRTVLQRNLLKRDWLRVKQALHTLPDHVADRSPSNTACAHLDLDTLDGLTRARLKDQYRRMSRRYHPDISKDHNAAEMFQRVQSAYACLSAYLDRKGTPA